MQTQRSRMGNVIHRHTGGLEKMEGLKEVKTTIHRHTGGLEIVW